MSLDQQAERRTAIPRYPGTGRFVVGPVASCVGIRLAA